MDLQPEKVIGHRYRLIRPYNQSHKFANSDTYIASDERFARQVLMERFPFPVVGSQVLDELNRYIDALWHPNILQIRDFLQEEDSFYIIFSYPATGKVNEIHPEGTKIPLQAVVNYTSQLASALQAAHNNQIIHGDIHPANIFINANNKIFLGNFVPPILLSDVNSLTYESHALYGAPEYMAPEKIQGKPIYASDQYALGIVVYEWLSGQLPFAGDSAFEVLTQQMTKSPKPLRAIAPEVPSQVEDVIMKALAKSSNWRFSSVQEFADALVKATPSLSAQGGWGEAASMQPSDSGTSMNAPPLPQPDIVYTWDPISFISPGERFTTVNELKDKDEDEVFLQSAQPESLLDRLKGFTGRKQRQSKRNTASQQEESQRQNTELALFAIARATLETDDTAIIGRIYSVQAGISQEDEGEFYSSSFKISVADPAQPVPFHILLHPGENVELLDQGYQSLRYYPGITKAQFIVCKFRLKFSGPSYIVVNFYRERQWLKSIRLSFDGVEQAISSLSSGER